METLLEIQINENYLTKKKAEFNYPIKTDYNIKTSLRSIPELISEIKKNYVLTWEDIHPYLGNKEVVFLKKVTLMTNEDNQNTFDLNKSITKKVLKTIRYFIEDSEKKLVEGGKKILNILYGVNPDLFSCKKNFLIYGLKKSIDEESKKFISEISKINDSNEKNDYLIMDRLDKIQRLDFARLSLSNLEKLSEEAEVAENILETYHFMNFPLKEKRDSMNHNLFMATLGEVERDSSKIYSSEKIANKNIKVIAPKYSEFLSDNFTKKTDTNFKGSLEDTISDAVNEPVSFKESLYESKKPISILKKTNRDEIYERSMPSYEFALYKQDKRVESAKIQYEIKKHKLADKQKMIGEEIAKKLAKRGYAVRVRE